MAVSTTNIQTYLSDFENYRSKKESLSTNTLEDLNTAEDYFLNLGWSPVRVLAAEQKLIYGWHHSAERTELLAQCENAAILLLQRYDEANTTFQDFWTVVFYKRQKKGLMNIIQWTGNQVAASRPLLELKFAP